MMTKRQLAPQQLTVEQEAPSPSKPITNPEIVPSVNEAKSVEGSGPIPLPETYLEDGVNREINSLENWLRIKVKDNLIGQIIRGEFTSGVVNLKQVYDTVHGQLEFDSARHFQEAQSLELDRIPRHLLKKPKETDSDNYAFWQQHTDNLYAHAEIHQEVQKHIDRIKDTGEDSLYDLAEHFVGEMFEAAKDEAIAILRKRQKDLEDHRANDAKEIAALKEVIQEISFVRHDQEMEEYLTATKEMPVAV